MAKQVTFEFDMGEHVKDVVTELEGVVITRAEHITGCLQYTVQPQGTDKDGKIKDCYYVDEARLRRVKKAAVKLAQPNAADGGPARAVSTPSPRRTS